MSTQTLNAGTLVSKWNECTSTTSKLGFTYNLQSFMEKELEKTLAPEEALLLKEYRETFDFDVYYSVKSEFDLCASYTHEIDCKDAEEVSSILSREEEVSKELRNDFDPYEAEVEVYEVGRFFPSVMVLNLKPKKEKSELERDIEESKRINSLQDSFKEDLWKLIDSHSLEDDFKATILLDAEETLNKRAEEECA